MTNKNYEVITSSSDESLWEEFYRLNPVHDYKIELINLKGNLGRDLIKAIYRKAYELEATEVVVTKSKYNRYALCELNCKYGNIASDYSISI